MTGQQGGGLLRGEEAALRVRGLVRRVAEGVPGPPLGQVAHLALQAPGDMTGRQRGVGGAEAAGRVAGAPSVVHGGQGRGGHVQVPGAHMGGDRQGQRVVRLLERRADRDQRPFLLAVDDVEPALGTEDERVEDDVVRDTELLAQHAQLFPGLGGAPGQAEPAGQEEPGGGQRRLVPAAAPVDDVAQQPLTALLLARFQQHAAQPGGEHRRLGVGAETVGVPDRHLVVGRGEQVLAAALACLGARGEGLGGAPGVTETPVDLQGLVRVAQRVARPVAAVGEEVGPDLQIGGQFPVEPGVRRQVLTASSTTARRVFISPISIRANAQNVPGGRQVCG